ncbi:hypothetical protein EX30DRAFT_115361 [Ascodesmis nigricans]|uniref:Uncharacterized protein n=1 Tax=Ascodesmis nigricans TaxID=341454 RepID=A0A4S2MPY8_9PEZI|nr:hypothetical protein EX30DRAFT_115361 [Ascodesmis nigricans]
MDHVPGHPNALVETPLTRSRFIIIIVLYLLCSSEGSIIVHLPSIPIALFQRSMLLILSPSRHHRYLTDDNLLTSSGSFEASGLLRITWGLS